MDTIDQTGDDPRILSSQNTTPSLVESQQLQQQLENEKQFKCDRCENSYKEDWLLTKHIALLHEPQMTHKCNLCAATFARGGLLTKHKTTVHKGNANHKCCVCKKYFVQKQHLIVHNQRIHNGIKQGLINRSSLDLEFLYS